MKTRILLLFLFVVLLNGCAQKPEMSLFPNERKGYFVGILQPSRQLFFPMGILLVVNHKLNKLDGWYYQLFSIKFFLKNKNDERFKTLYDYEYYFVIVKGEMLEDKIYTIKEGDNFEMPSSIFPIKLKVNEIVYLRPVDKEFVKCLFNKEISGKKYSKYYLKHPKKILKLCPCKPIEKIKKR